MCKDIVPVNDGRPEELGQAFREVILVYKDACSSVLSVVRRAEFESGSDVPLSSIMRSRTSG